ncbi:MAG: type VI secretion system-associated protein TagF [Gammaproteobacteria bacterium]|nr:type VI secretion system-associated protein TagF [Gammaproteobacteria bacterium]
MSAESATGFYGKLPCRGDFMQRRVPQGFVDTWDAWLQECLYVSRQQLAEQWLDLYLTSPVWRFVLTEGICGERAYAGVMLPSVDRVGRYFPLTLVAPLEPGTCILEAACGAGRAWFDAAEELALKALDASDLDLQAFDNEVDALLGLGDYPGLALSNQLMDLVAQSGFARSGSSWHIPMPGETPQSGVNAFASLELQRTFRPCGLWWTQGSQAVQPGWLVTTGLPTPNAYIAMLSGEWRRAGWSSIELAMQAQQSAALSEGPTVEMPRPLEVQIAAAHAPLRRGMGASAEIRYIMRPEAGLWGVATAAGDSNDSGARADLVSDVAHDLAPQATLTTRIESARRALHGVLGARAGAVGGSAEGVAVILFLAERTECALMWSGAARAIRIRNGTATELLAGERPTAADTVVDPLASPQLDGGGADDEGLLALLATPAKAEPAIGVRYQELEVNDLWVLGIEGSVPETVITRLLSAWPGTAPAADAAPDSSAAPSLDRVLDSVLAQQDPLMGAAEPPAPLFLITAQLAARTAV